MLFCSTSARHRIRHGIRHTAARAGRGLCACVANGRLRYMRPGIVLDECHRMPSVVCRTRASSPAFERILAPLYDATLDDTHWPATSALIDEACGIAGSALLVGKACATSPGRWGSRKAPSTGRWTWCGWCCRSPSSGNRARRCRRGVTDAPSTRVPSIQRSSHHPSGLCSFFFLQLQTFQSKPTNHGSDETGLKILSLVTLQLWQTVAGSLQRSGRGQSAQRSSCRPFFRLLRL